MPLSSAYRRARIAAAALVALLSVSLVAPLTAQGRINVLNSRGEVAPLTGATMVRETLAQVSFRRGGPESKVETRRTALVVEVSYGAGSEAWEEAKQARNANRFQDAATLFTTAGRDTEPPWVASLALIELAEVHALRGPDHVAAAQTAINRFLDEYPDHRQLPRALLLAARLAAQTGRSSDAIAFVQRVIDLADQSTITPDWSVRAQITLGQELLAAGDGAAASDAFTAAGRSADSALQDLDRRQDLKPVIEALSLSARSGIGGAMLAQNQIDSARSFFQQLARDGGDDAAIAAAAGNGLAEADFKEDNLKDAQLGFARIAVTGVSVPDEHAKALYYLGRCADSLGLQGLEQGGRQKARDYYAEVQARYPASHWARLSQQSN